MNDKDALIEVFDDSLTHMMDMGEFDEITTFEDFEEVLGFSFSTQLLDNETIKETYKKFYNSYIPTH